MLCCGAVWVLESVGEHCDVLTVTDGSVGYIPRLSFRCRGYGESWSGNDHRRRLYRLSGVHI